MKTVDTKGKKYYMDVHFEDGKVARFTGKMIAEDLVVDKDSLKEWKEPAGSPISEREKREIIDAINEINKESKINIIFE